MQFMNKKHLKILKKELESIEINLTLNQEIVNKGINKLEMVRQLANISINNIVITDCLNIKKEEYPIFMSFINNAKSQIEALTKLKELKEKEIQIMQENLDRKC